MVSYLIHTLFVFLQAYSRISLVRNDGYKKKKFRSKKHKQICGSFINVPKLLPSVIENDEKLYVLITVYDISVYTYKIRPHILPGHIIYKALRLYPIDRNIILYNRVAKLGGNKQKGLLPGPRSFQSSLSYPY